MDTELNEELKACIRHEDNMHFIQHPLLGVVPYSEDNHARYNEQLEACEKHVARVFRKKDYCFYIWLYARPYRLKALNHIFEHLTTKQKVQLSLEVYSDSEGIDKKEWLNLFKKIDSFLADDEGNEYYNSLNDDEELIIYKGISTSAYNESDNETISWTLDIDIATFFANRWDKGVVLKAKVLKKDILGIIFGRNESEILVLPENLYNKCVYEYT